MEELSLSGFRSSHMNEKPFLSAAELEDSPVVANCCMNRERDLHGSNGYAVELGFDLLAWLKNRLAKQYTVRWLDLCWHWGHPFNTISISLVGSKIRCSEGKDSSSRPLLAQALFGCRACRSCDRQVALSALPEVVPVWSISYCLG